MTENVAISMKKDVKSPSTVKVRLLRHELLSSLVWLYAKMITPLLALTAVAMAGLLYWRLGVVGSNGIVDKLIILPALFIGLNAVVMIFADVGGDDGTRVEVTRDQAPDIWAEIDTISRHATCPPIDRLFVDESFNASASLSNARTLRRRAALEVTIGVPLMSALTPLECATVIAHEIGHHHGDDSRRTLAIHSAMVRANNIVDMHQSSLWVVCLPTTVLFSLYTKVMEALFLPLSRKWEHDADAFAAQVYGAEACGRTDVAIHLFADDMDELIMGPVQKAYESGSAIPANIFQDLPERLSEMIASKTLQDRLQHILTIETRPQDTHPSLKDRLAHIGAVPALPAFDPETVASTVWLGASHDAIVEEVQTRWMQDFAAHWSFEFQFKRERLDWADKIFKGTEAVLEQEPANRSAWFARVACAHESHSYEDVQRLTQRAIEMCPDEPDFELKQARFEYQDDNPQCIIRLLKLIETKADCSTETAWSTLNLAADEAVLYSERFPRLASAFADDELKKLIKQLKKPAAQIQDRQSIWPETDVERATLPNWQLDAFKAHCAYYRSVEQAWIFRAKHDDQFLPRFFVVVAYPDIDEMDECHAFGSDFDSTDIPMRGLLCHARVVMVRGKPAGRLARLQMPRAVAAEIDRTEPHFDRSTDGVDERTMEQAPEIFERAA